MALQKNNLNINFGQGLDTKTDPWQVQAGKMLSLQNTIFDKGGLLQKRNGFGSLPSLPNNTSTFLTTFNGDLTAIGTNLNAYSSGSKTWLTKGTIQPLTLDTLTLIRNNLNQTQSDSVVAPNGLVCTVYTETDGTSFFYKYAIADSVTGQNFIAPTLLPTVHATLGTPKVFLMNFYFIIVYTDTNPNLVFIAISINNPTTVTAVANVSSSYTPDATVSFDGAVLSGSLWLAWNGGSSSGVKMAFIDQSLTVSTAVAADPAHLATIMSVTADQVNGIIWATYWDTSTGDGYTLALATNLVVLAGFPKKFVGTTVLNNIASIANSGTNNIFFELANNYSYDSGIPTHFIDKITCTQSATFGGTVLVARSVGLASKAFLLNGVIYFLVTYKSPYQDTYFLMDSLGHVIAKVAYSNGSGYFTAGLPNVSINNGVSSISYLIKDLIQAANKDTNVPSGIQTAGIYTQLGINLVSFTIGTSNLSTAEIGTNLNISGGILWAYDGYLPVEQGFFLYPDSVEATTATGSGSIAAGTYFYQATYEWTDNQGNLFRSAPSLPIKQVTTTSSSTNTINVPTLRLTYKTANPVKIVLYRYSVAQPIYYQVTSISAPTLNDVTVDSVAITDTFSDATILGNNILYTTGGVVENIGPPPAAILTLFKSRLFLLDSEDKNLLWYSKQVIESTPVEMSDLFTLFIAPTVGAQGSTGPITALAALDDKLVIWKGDAIYYITGNGPDNTGANNDFSEPVFITSTVGCTNQQSIVFQPQGLMFQSDKGIWLLGRDLSTQFIGAPVQDFTQSSLVKSAVNVPATNQVRFTLDSGKTLMFDYFYGQWGEFINIPAISSTIFQKLHTYITAPTIVTPSNAMPYTIPSAAFQETPGLYLDGSNPVLMSFTTAWFNLAGLQGFERAYEFYILGKYLTPHKLNIGIAYDYNPSIVQNDLISPTNFNSTFGSDPLFGSSVTFGGVSDVEQWRIFLRQQKCESFQITLAEVYDASFGVVAGAGLTISGIDLTIGAKGTKPKLAATNYVG
jgi:hypothetical protein